MDPPRSTSSSGNKQPPRPLPPGDTSPGSRSQSRLDLDGDAAACDMRRLDPPKAPTVCARGWAVTCALRVMCPGVLGLAPNVTDRGDPPSDRRPGLLGLAPRSPNAAMSSPQSACDPANRSPRAGLA